MTRFVRPNPNDEVIGGDSVRDIQRRLLAQYPSPSVEIIDMARIEAQDLFEVKVQIIQKKKWLNGTQLGIGWGVGRGARALDNLRTASGEESLEGLYEIWDDLQEIKPLSDEFSKLREKDLKKR
ncbi:uncharacterized mitochondrial protein AtMg01010 [Malania oleifera]|uniref:uncharacterized mitochondrial protein AtMg01010 n=1 Tax=Malania oleifera TaxID=397392 RepID=UPI0025AE68F9|nr:uncharacterized mitochondrial protein AtMg01010 [Malania oleifera]